MLKKAWFEEDMSILSFGTTKVLINGSFRKKNHLNVAFAESHRVWYKEGSGASSQRSQSCKACAWGCPY